MDLVVDYLFYWSLQAHSQGGSLGAEEPPSQIKGPQFYKKGPVFCLKIPQICYKVH